MDIDFKKFYSIGKQLAGDNGEDLVHICYERLMMKKIQPNDLDGYFYRMMVNQVKEKSSLYNRNYSRNSKKDFDTLECEYFDINIEQIKEIIKELKKEGRYLYSVKAFEELAQTRNYLEFTRKTGIRYETLIRITTFIRKKIVNNEIEDITISNKTKQRLQNYFES